MRTSSLTTACGWVQDYCKEESSVRRFYLKVWLSKFCLGEYLCRIDYSLNAVFLDSLYAILYNHLLT